MTAKEQGLPELMADLLSVLEAGQEASLPLTWIGLTEQTPEQAKEFLTKAVDCTVEDGVFTGEVHGIAEAETDLVVAITGCGPKGAANAKHLIWCAHFVHKHKAALAALASDTGERGVVEGPEITGIPDARAWADRFKETHPDLPIDRGAMIGWFANAMMAAHDHARAAPVVVTPEILAAVAGYYHDGPVRNWNVVRAIESSIAALRAQPAGGGEDELDDETSCATGSAEWQRGFNAGREQGRREIPLTQPQPVEGGKCGCLDFCEYHGRDFIEVTPDGQEYCHECSSDDGSGELCTPMAGSCDMLSQRANEFQQAFMCPAHAAENVKFCEDSYADSATPPESGGQGEAVAKRIYYMRRDFDLSTVERTRFWARECRYLVEALAQGGGNER